jgi:hypothetical protein
MTGWPSTAPTSSPASFSPPEISRHRR